MYSGFLTESIDIYTLIKEPNQYGELVEVKHKTYTCRAKVNHLSGSRTVLNSEIQVPYQKTFVVRYHVPVDENCMIKYRNKFYTVLSIDRDREMQQTVIIAQVNNE